MSQEFTKDELDLLELFKYFFKKKLAILAIVLFSMAVSLGSMFYQGPMYQASAILIPPLTTDLSAINYNRNAITPLKPVLPYDVYLVFKNTLLADYTKQQFFKGRTGLNSAKMSITNGLPAEVQVDSYASKKADAVKNLNQYVAFSEKSASVIVLDSLIKEVDAAKINVQKELELAINDFKNTKQKQLVRLNNALHMAEVLAKQQVIPVQNALEDIVNAAYLRGVAALKVEINSLNKQDPSNFQNAQMTALTQIYNKLDLINLKELKLIMWKTKSPIVVSDNLQYKNWPRNAILSSAIGALLAFLILTFAFIRTKNAPI